jgi:uncharacterized damage-inducible protein DinB
MLSKVLARVERISGLRLPIGSQAGIENMEQNATLATFYENWKLYQDHLKIAIAPLTPEQLAVRAAPELRTVGEIAAHNVRARVHWFTGFLGEKGVEVIKVPSRDEPVRDAAEIVRGLDASWELMAKALARWSSDDMQETFPEEWRGKHYELSRGWVVWHILEHDLHHGGEVSLLLGMRGLTAPDI